MLLHQITPSAAPELYTAGSCDLCQIRCAGSAHRTFDFSLNFECLHLSSVPSPAATQSQSTILGMMKHGSDLNTASCNAVLSRLQAHGTCIKISFIGTQPERQGQGLGGQLLRAVSMQDVQHQQIRICCCWWLSQLFCMLWHLFKIALHMSACCTLLLLQSCLRMYAIPYSALLCCSDIIATSRHNSLYSSLQSVCKTGLNLLQINKVADAEQQWVYIEASSERGTHLYLRNGFQIVKEAKPQPDAPTIYCMGRPPKPDVPSDV